MPQEIETLSALEGILQHSKDPTFNKYFLVFQQLKNEKDASKRVKALEWLASSFEFMESDNTEKIKEYISQGEVITFSEVHGPVVKAMLRALVNSNPKEEDFYARTWDIVNNSQFPEDKDKALALYTIMNTRLTPFFHLEAVDNIPEDQWQDIVRKTKSLRQKITFILTRKLKTKYQQADALLQVLDSLEGQEKRVLLASLIDTILYLSEGREN